MGLPRSVGPIMASASGRPHRAIMTSLKKGWILSPKAFRQFLNWLDERVDSDGAKYIEMHRRLAGYFDRRNCPFPVDLADEALNRVARKLEEKGEIVGASARTKDCVCRFVGKR